jgi:hypothetical protein
VGGEEDGEMGGGGKGEDGGGEAENHISRQLCTCHTDTAFAFACDVLFYLTCLSDLCPGRPLTKKSIGGGPNRINKKCIYFSWLIDALQYVLFIREIGGNQKMRFLR